MRFWTNACVVGNKIGIRGVDRNGVRVTKKVPFTPTLYMYSNHPTEYTTYDGSHYLEPIKTGNIWETKDYIKQHEEIENYKLFGNPRAEYAYITENFPKDVDFDSSLIYVANIDIEVDSSNGTKALDVAAASEKIVSITLETAGKYHVWGLKSYTPHIPNVTYYQCADEIELLGRFLYFWTKDYPDVVTGWNIGMYDIPYLLHRITNIFGADRAKTLSPWGRTTNRRVVQFGREHFVYGLQGLDVLDYMDLFKKFSRNAAQESYKLGDIAFAITGEEKVNYDDEGSLAALYSKNFQKFIEYNIHDTTLIRKIDQKEKLLELAFTLAYQSHTNISDVFSQVRMWTQIIDDYLAREGKFSTAYRWGDTEKEEFEGAYVKEASSGLFNWVVSFDATSLYPSLIMQHNISPDTFIEPVQYSPQMREVMAQNINVETLYDRKIDTSALSALNVTLTANGHLFQKDRRGFLPKIIAGMFEKRQIAKKKMLAAEKLVEALKEDPTSTPEKALQAENDASRYDALQNALKTALNSAFGALGNQYFVHFDVRLAEAITITGKLSNLWATRTINEYLSTTLKLDKCRDFVIAADTDSAYVHLGPLIDKVYGEQPSVKDGIAFMDKVCAGPLAKVLDKAFIEFASYLNVYEQKIYFKREALADRAIWSGGKKRYIVNIWNQEGVAYSEAKIKIKGFEMVKSSHPKICRDKMKAAVKVILNQTEPDLWKFIDDFRKEFKTLSPETIAFPRSCNNLRKYQGTGNEIYKLKTPQNVKAALIYNHLVRKMKLDSTIPLIDDGDKIRFVKLYQPNPVHDDVVAFPYTLPPQLNLHDFIDYDTMFDSTFIEPLKIILNAIGWKTKKEVSLRHLFTLKRN